MRISGIGLTAPLRGILQADSAKSNEISGIHQAGNSQCGVRLSWMQQAELRPAIGRVTMGTQISNALAFAPWHGMREFRHVSHNEIIFLVVAGLAVLVLVVMAVQRRRRRWF